MCFEGVRDSFLLLICCFGVWWWVSGPRWPRFDLFLVSLSQSGRGFVQPDLVKSLSGLSKWNQTRLCIYVYIYILLCSISGRFFFANRFKNARFFSCTWNEWKWQKPFLPPAKGKQFSGQQPLNVHLGLSSNAFKNGALMLRNISTPLLNGYTRAILERFNSPSLHALFLKPQNPWNPYFCSVSWRFCGCFWPPPKPTTRIFSPHNRITAKVRFVNKVGALFVFKKRSWNLNFHSVWRAKIENASFFLLLPCPILKPKPFEKILALGGSTCFRPNSPIMTNGKKYIDPSGLTLPTSPPQGSPQNDSTETETHKQPAKT